MIEDNAEIYATRASIHIEAAGEEGRIMNSFLATRFKLEALGTPMTGQQKVAALALLTDARAEREATAALVDEAFDATDPLL